MKIRIPFAPYIPGHKMIKYIGRFQWLYRNEKSGAIITVRR